MGKLVEEVEAKANPVETCVEENGPGGWDNNREGHVNVSV